MNTTDDLDRMLSGGAKSAKFEQPGDSIAGIVDEVAVRQATEYGTGKPLTFDNGDPREQIVVIVKVDNHIPEDENDDGFRAIYIKGWGQQRRAFIQAVRDGGKPRQGDRFTATLTAYEPSKGGGFPAKVYEYRVQALDHPDAPASLQAEVSDAEAQALKLWRMGSFTVEQISAATSLTVPDVQGIVNADALPF
jgi:hypothetical protein